MVKSVAIIGAGASGAAAAAALDAEDYFTSIKIFERRSEAGGVWKFDPDPGPLPLKPGALPPTIDHPLPIPKQLPCTAPRSRQNRFDKTPVYDGLQTNVPDVAMCFSDMAFPSGPFVGSAVPKAYVQQYFSLHGLDDRLVLNTTLEDLTRLEGDRWKLVLRKHDAARKVDEWWEEEFDAVILANGHYGVPYIPHVDGLDEFMRKFPWRIEHSKTYRTEKAYANLNVVVIGNSASGHDVVQHLHQSKDTKKPVYLSRHSSKGWDGGKAPPGMEYKPIISKFNLDGSIVFDDGSILKHIDKVIYCTGYKPSFPFWNSSRNGRNLFDYRTNRLINNYQHTLLQDFPTLGIVGFPQVLTFRSFEYQSIALARLWSGRNAHPLPSIPEQKAWEEERAEITQREHRKFHQIFWDNGETMVWLRWFFEFAGLPRLEGRGRCPPVLNDRTRWAIDHVRRYPGPRAIDKDGDQVLDGWEDVGDEKREDALWFS